MRLLLASIFIFLPHTAQIESLNYPNAEESKSSPAISLAGAGHHVNSHTLLHTTRRIAR